MRGRLRVVGVDRTTWAEVPPDFWTDVLGADVERPVIPEPQLIAGSETPEYGEYSLHFTIKVYHGGDLDDSVKAYVGGDISYFDMCEELGFCLKDLESMCGELGLEKGTYDLWYCLPLVTLENGLTAIENDAHVCTLLDMTLYSKILQVYVTPRHIKNWNYEWDDFSFTQLLEDERIERVSGMIEESENVRLENQDEDENVEGEDKQDEDEDESFQGDSSNLDSTDSEVEITPKKKRTIPPPNPPYRTRRKGRYSMLRGLFKNTEDTPVILDDSEPPIDHGSQEDKLKRSNKKRGTVRKKKEKIHEAPEKNVIEEDQEVPSKEEAPHEEIEPEKSPSTEEGNCADIQGLTDSSSEGGFNSEDERMAANSSTDEDDIQYPEFNEISGMDDPQFAIGMLFTCGKVFRAAVRKHAIVHQRPIKLRKNLSDKIKWVCADGCDWKCYGTKLKKSPTIQIKTLCKTHTCNPTWDQKCVNSTWIANKYEDEIRMNPTWATNAFHLKVVNDLKCGISLSMIYRALKKARENIIGKHEAEYGQLFAYGNELLRQMPASTVKIMSEPAEEGVEGRRFKRFYVCLGPLKEGFLDGCRPIIGLDGCHLRGPLGGILLTAVATDPNDGMYPLAWAQVEAENNDSWEWFIGFLKDDLRMSNAGTYTFISDRQKGLVKALESQVPEAEHRFCVMHMYQNITKEHKSIGVRRLLWCAARATTEYFFKKHMDELKDQGTSKIADKRPPKCHYCTEEGHNSRTCTSKAVDAKRKKEEEATGATESEKISKTENCTSPGGKRTKQLAGRSKRSSPIKTCNEKCCVVKCTHGGIVKPFKPPTQTGEIHPVRGQQYTSLKNLEAARLQKQKNLAKKK